MYGRQRQRWGDSKELEGGGNNSTAGISRTSNLVTEYCVCIHTRAVLAVRGTARVPLASSQLVDSWSQLSSAVINKPEAAYDLGAWTARASFFPSKIGRYVSPVGEEAGRADSDDIKH